MHSYNNFDLNGFSTAGEEVVDMALSVVPEKLNFNFNDEGSS